jgi:hypothetical protein
MGEYLTVTELAKKYNITINSVYAFTKKHSVRTKGKKVEKTVMCIDEEDFFNKWNLRRRQRITINFVKALTNSIYLKSEDIFITEGINNEKNVFDYNIIKTEQTLAYVLYKAFGKNIRVYIKAKELNIDYEKFEEEIRKLGWKVEAV